MATIAKMDARSGTPGSPVGIILRLIGLAILDAFAIWFITRLFADQAWVFGVLVVIVTIGINAFFLSEKLYAFRWFSPGLALMILMVVYPMLSTIYVAFTNYGSGHILSRQQTIDLLLEPRGDNLFIPEGATEYQFAAYRSEDGRYLLWLIDEAGRAFAAAPGEPLMANGEGLDGVGTLDSDGFPETIQGYTRLNRIEIASDDILPTLVFGTAEDSIGISGRRAARFELRYSYDEASDTLTDRESGVAYTAVDGVYTAADGSVLPGGYFVWVGLRNFIDLATSPALSGPLVQIFIWTIMHAFLAVLITFVVGLSFALVFNSDLVPGKKILRSAMLIPYAMPAFIAVLIWRGLLSENLGPISIVIRDWFGWSPPWFTDYFWSRVGVLVVQMWLGFPYMMLICTGALQSIPSEIYEASEVDGASAWQRFWNLTLPLLLVAVGPILISSFSFNFNNFGVIRLYNQGGPPMTPTAGWTDILISYTYRIAFSSGQSDYGLASAITIVIFAIVLVITVLNFRFTGTWEEVSQNV
ncbi:MAG: ABC transporter permease subunit [Chloroflexi bacterium]|nr:ABC transporter permease subunit [Chloroflexota bacterium]